MMKLSRVKLLAGVSAGILFSTLAVAEDYATADTFKSIGSEAGKSALSSARSSIPAESFEEAVGKFEKDLIDKGAQDEFSEKFKEAQEKTKNWKSRTKNIGQIDGLLDSLAAKKKEQQKKDLAAQKSSFNKMASLANGAVNPAAFQAPGTASKACTTGVNFSGMQQEAQNFVSGPVKKLNAAVQQILSAEGKKAEKEAQANLVASIAAAEKELSKQEDPEIEALLKSEIPQDISELEREKVEAKAQAILKKSKQQFSRAVLEMVKKQAPLLAKAKTQKSLFSEITQEYSKMFTDGLNQFRQVAASSAKAAQKNCAINANSAGATGFEDAGKGKNSTQQASPFIGPAVDPRSAALTQSFSADSAATNAMKNLVTMYGNSTNFVPVTEFYRGLFGNMVNEISCPDVSPQLDQLVGQNLTNQIAEITKVQDDKALAKGVEGITNAVGAAMNNVAKLFNDPANPDSGALASCELAEDTRKQIDQFAQNTKAQADAIAQQQQGPGRRGGVQQAAAQQPTHF